MRDMNNDTHRNIIVLGGGASGLAAAIVAARNGAHVSVFDKADRVGKSILATGNGRCNIANAATGSAVYHNADFVERVFRICSPHDALQFLSSCGLLLRQESDGRLYPQANKATSVLDALRLTASKLGIREVCGRNVVGVSRLQSGEWLVSFQGTIPAVRCDAIVIACGKGFNEQLLADVSSNQIYCRPFVPVLGPLRTDTDVLRGLDKIRVKCSLTWYSPSSDVQRIVELGEVIFRTFGISGIAAFNISRFAQPGDRLSIDLLPSFARDASLPYLNRRLASLGSPSWRDFFCGMMLPPVARAVCGVAGVAYDGASDSAYLDRVDSALRTFPLICRGIGDPRLCQVHRGGIAVRSCDSTTLGLRGAYGLYAAGEALDVDAPCGGYNLHWAWASGMIAGQSAARGDRA